MKRGRRRRKEMKECNYLHESDDDKLTCMLSLRVAWNRNEPMPRTSQNTSS